METRSGELQRIGFVLLAFALAFLACGAAYASDVERRIPVIRDTAGSGLTAEISREGTRLTATPFLTLNDTTARRIEDRIAKMAAGVAEKVSTSGETVADTAPRTGLTGTQREESGRPETAPLSSPPPLPGEITVRSVKGFLKGLRASRKEKPVPAVVVAIPERRLGRTDTSSSEAD